ncbi:MAG: lipopolysaccharide biosynthesis protein [Balneola sp.]
MSNLKEKTINGVFWSFIQNFSTQINAFIVGIILARLLSPREFGLIGMLTIFIALSQTLVNSGLKDALIRKSNCNQVDYSTAFFFNIAMSVFLYIALFFSANIISDFYDEPKLVNLVRVLSFTLIINAFTLIQKARLIRDINFKLITKVEVIASLLSGIIAIIMAYLGFGVWSLVAKTLLISFFTVILFWFWSKWTPSLTFSRESFRELFSFGSKLALMGVIGTIFNNIYYLVIGKYYSANQLGFYTKAEGFKDFPSKGITNIVQKVTYPVLSKLKDDKEKLNRTYIKLFETITFLCFTALFGLSAISVDFTIVLLGEEWQKAGEYLQLLCFVGIFYPLDALNMNIMKVLGKSTAILNIGLLRRVLTIPVLIIGIYYGINEMIVALIVHQIISYLIYSSYAGRFIEFGTLDQVKRVAPSVFMSGAMFFILMFLGEILEVRKVILVLIQIVSGIFFILLFSELLKIKSYVYLKKTAREKLQNFKNKGGAE